MSWLTSPSSRFATSLMNTTTRILGSSTPQTTRGPGLAMRSWPSYTLKIALPSCPRRYGIRGPAAILTEYLGTSTSFNETERKYLLRQAAVHAPEVLARRITQLVSAALMKGRQPF